MLSGILLALFCGVALFIRVYFTYDQVFVGEWIKFTGRDAYYQMRLIDNLLQNFPHRITFDPYFYYPIQGLLAIPPFFHWLLGGITWVIGLGSPSQHIIDIVGVYFPAVLGALTVIPVYFIGKELFGRWAGVLAAGLIAILPGEFLGRSILGFTDYHILETLLTTTTMMFFILAIKAAKERQLTFHHLSHKGWALSGKPIVYSVLCGIFLTIYHFTWPGALLFVFIIIIYLVIQFIIDHLRRESTDYLCLVGVIPFLIVLILFMPYSRSIFFLTALIIAMLIPPALSGISRLMTSKRIKPAYYPLSLLGFGLAGVGIFLIINPSLLNDMLMRIVLFFIPTSGIDLTVSEMQGLFTLLIPGGDFFNTVAWGNFNLSFILSLISLTLLIYLVIKRSGADKTILVVWSLVILAAAIAQRRYAYYLAVNVALLTGYLSWQVLRLTRFTELASRQRRIPRRAQRGSLKTKPDERHRHSPITIRHISVALAVIVIFFAVYFPNIKPGVAIAQQAPFTPSDAWVASLSWLKENTPDPFGDPNFYYQRYEPPASAEDAKHYEYPDSAYGVMAWWDYGYWISRIAHRLPNTCPGPLFGRAEVAQFFLSQDEDSARGIIQELDSAYIIIDFTTTTTKLWAIAEWSGKDAAYFYDVYYVPQEGKLVPVYLFYPEYYRSLSIRLYSFDGKAVTPESSIVISYEERVTNTGEQYKQVVSAEPFSSYEEAHSYISSQNSANYRIVSNDPFVSPVPLEAVKDYKLLYSSDNYVVERDAGAVPEVKIFEYIGE